MGKPAKHDPVLAIVPVAKSVGSPSVLLVRRLMAPKDTATLFVLKTVKLGLVKLPSGIDPSPEFITFGAISAALAVWVIILSSYGCNNPPCQLARNDHLVGAG